ncbi:M20 metallopeptidase family protein [Ekhidna sp.]
MKRFVFLISISLFSFGFFVATPLVDLDGVTEDVDYLVDLYKSLHQSPELSLQEKETSKKLANELRKVGFEVTENFGGYGIVGILKNGEGPTILYRTDMDALPMYEKTELPYASKVEVPYNGGIVGTMHSCGHDIHMTNWVGTARYMSQNKDQWKGTLMFIGQPAEEIGEGAKLMLEAGLYEKFGVPDYGLGLHSSPTLPAGTVGLSDGYTMATAEFADIKVFGIGAHGASPHMSIDPVVVASMIVMDLQTIASRSVKPVDDVVVTVGAIKGGTKHNIIPDEVTLQLTIRTFTEEVRQLVHKRIEEISRGVAIAAGLPEDKMPEVIFNTAFTPSNFNNTELIQSMRKSAKKVIDDDKVMEAEPQMVAEDFSLYGLTEHKVPTVLFWLGTVPDHRIQSGDLPGLHSPFYYPEPEKSLETGVAVVSQTMLDLFKQ